MGHDIHSREYRAIDPKDRNTVDAVELRLSDGRLFSIRRMDMGVTLVSADQTAMTQLFRGGSAVFWGSGLAELSRALARWSIEWVQAFDARRFDRPADRSALFVESIDIYMGNGEDNPQPDVAAGSGAAGQVIN